MFDAILLAAGASARMKTDKLSLTVGGESFLERIISVFDSLAEISRIILVVGENSDINSDSQKIIKVTGGETRTQSVRNALKEVKANYVLIHDAARPFVSADLINKIIKTTMEKGSCVPSVPVTDSIREVDEGVFSAFPDRSKLFAAQTPQGFEFDKLMEAYQKAEGTYTDDSEVFAKLYPVYTIDGEVSNKKVTYPEDVLGIAARVGIGYDSHRLEEGRTLVIGGVEIPFAKGFVAHSDGDILIHAVIDALLSAGGERDIGTFFPDTRPEYKGISSIKLLEKVKTVLDNKNIRINSVSAVVIIEKPKLSPYINQMRENIAKTLKISPDKIAISAKTNEGAGEIGKGLIAVSHAIASIY